MKLGKKLLSLLTVFCLTLSLLPTMALADDDVSVGSPGSTANRATAVIVDGKNLSQSTPYLIKQGTTYTTSSTAPAEGTTEYVYFNASNGTLTLSNYTGTSGISATGDLTINLVGRNAITGSGNLIKTSTSTSVATANLTIKSNTGGSLTVNNTGSNSVSTTIYSNSNITITGNATVTATINGTAQAIHSASESGKITIEDHAAVTATNTNSTDTPENGIAILAGLGSKKSNPTGTIEVKDSATLTARGHGKALACATFTATESTVKASTDYEPTNPGDYTEGNLSTYKYVNVTPAVVNYDVWVAGTQVTSANKDDVLGDGTVTYTPATTTEAQKLTLNNATIDSGSTDGIHTSTSDALIINLKGKNTITGSDNSIFSSGPLTITSEGETKGSLTMSSAGNLTTVYATADITISGSAIVNATIDGNAQAINSSVDNGKITITDTAKVTAKNIYAISNKNAEHSYAVLAGVDGTHDGTIEVGENASLLAQGSTQALICATFTYPEGKARVSTNYMGTNLETCTSTSTTNPTYKYVEVAPVEEYDVWVSGTQVTSANKNNVLNDSSTTATHSVSYNPSTKTLTLNGADITGAGNRQYTSAITDACGIYAKHDLNIQLIGDNNTVQGATEQPNGSYGIFVSGILTFTEGSSASPTAAETVPIPSITVSGGTSSNSGNAWVPGVYATSGITVKNCNVTAIGGTATNDTYPVAYAMSKAPTLVGVKVVATNTTNRADGATTTYDKSRINRYQYLQIQKSTTENETVAAPVITPEGGYFTGSATVTITCPMSDATIHYTENGDTPTASSTTYDASNPITFSENKTIKAIAVKGNVSSGVVTAEFTKRTGDAVTAVTLSLDARDCTLKVGDTSQLTATVKHETTTIDGLTVTWTSDNEEVATVAGGVITAKDVGKARITAAVVENGVTYSDFCDVIVEARPSSSHSSSSTTYYDVNAAVSGEGGSVAASTKRAAKGTTVTVTATAASGYQVAQVSAVDKDGKAVSLTDKGDGVYTFVMPASKVDVTARFAQIQKPEEKDPYGDVSKDSYYYDAVKWAAETGVTTGVAEGLFAPEWVCTRGQIVTFLWRASGSPATKATQVPFTDVAADAYYAQAVLWAVENGITNGTSETTFSPDQTCTRAHAVAFLYRMSGSPAAAGSTFSDVAADAYYSAAVAWAVEKGITNGTSGTTFSPDDTCTRGQIVTFLYRLEQAK